MRHLLIGVSGAAVVATFVIAASASTETQTQSANAAQSGQNTPRKKLLFLTYPGVAYHASLDPAEQAVTELGKAGGFDVTIDPKRQKSILGSDKIDVSFITPEYLAQFDGIMMMTNGNPPFTEAQKKSLVDFVRNGKALIGAHCATVTFYDYPPFGEMLGAYYRRAVRQGAIVVLKVEDQNHPATRMLGGVTWPVVDEFYHFAKEPWNESRPTENVSNPGNFKIPMGFTRDRVNVLLSIDTERSNLANLPEVVKGGDYPQSWWRNFGKGKVFYTSMGHRADIWSNDPVFRAHVTGGIRWALGLEN
jgi:type 1 glutamine amidotransferase